MEVGLSVEVGAGVTAGSGVVCTGGVSDGVGGSGVVVTDGWLVGCTFVVDDDAVEVSSKAWAIHPAPQAIAPSRISRPNHRNGRALGFEIENLLFVTAFISKSMVGRVVNSPHHLASWSLNSLNADSRERCP